MGYGMKYTKGGFPFKASPTKQKVDKPQQGPQQKSNMGLLPGEKKGTSVYKGDKKFDRNAKAYKFPTTQNKAERINDYEDRAEFAGSNDGNKQLASDLQREADIINDRKEGALPFKPKGMTGSTKQQKKNKRAKFSSDVKSFATGKKKALELKQGEHNSKEFQAKVEKNIELRDEGRTLPQYTRKKR